MAPGSRARVCKMYRKPSLLPARHGTSAVSFAAELFSKPLVVTRGWEFRGLNRVDVVEMKFYESR